MSEYTSLEVSKRLEDAGFVSSESVAALRLSDGKPLMSVADIYDTEGKVVPCTHAYRSDTLLAWLLSHGDSIEITPDLDGFNCTFWKGHADYNGISIFLPDALAEVVMKVMEVSK